VIVVAVRWHLRYGTMSLSGPMTGMNRAEGLDQPTSPPEGTKDIRASGPKSLLFFTWRAEPET
jgi:hypothetical protein